MSTKQKIVERIRDRLDKEISSKNPLKFLKDFSPEVYYDVLIANLYLYTRPKKGVKNKSIIFVEIICAIGHSVRSTLKQKKDSSLASKTGAFLLYVFEEMELVKAAMGAGSGAHQALLVIVLDDDKIAKLWSTIDTSKVEKLPALKAYAPWKSTRHSETNTAMIKTFNKKVLDSVTPATHPLLFECLNRAQEVGWVVNRPVYNLHSWALRNRTDAFADIWEQSNPDAKITKLREARAIGDIAKRFLDATFYHLYYYDFRGRKYPTTAYLHEQGSDLARGLLLRADKKPIGKPGYFWLMVSIASNWAGDAGRPDGAKTDKIPLADRVAWAIDNEEIFLSYAEKPKVNQGWMQADSPWQFIAACFELFRLRTWQAGHGDFEDYSFESSLEVYIDGSNNGSQHLSALTKDEVTAPHVNLVPLEMPGDLYKYVGEHVWTRIAAKVAEMDPALREKCEVFIDNVIELKKQIQAAEPKSDARAELVEKIRALKIEDSVTTDASAPVFWNRVVDAKQRRKIVKRNVMTLPYGGTPYGLGEQQITDAKKHSIDLLLYMEHRWGAYMGREVFEDCRTSLERPMRLLSVFEAAGRAAETRGEFLSWTVPVTGFPVVQNYTEGVVKKTWVQYGPPKGERMSTGYFENTYQLHICFVEIMVPSKGRQASAASPNAIHSLDAAHLTMTVCACDFPVTTIHDSFGCLLADMPALFKTVRETFVELYKENPLQSLMKEIDGDITGLELGTLDLSGVLDSDYCFC